MDMMDMKEVRLGDASSVAAMIAEIVFRHSETRNGAAAIASGVMECVVAATSPLLFGLFNGGSLQERLLFALVLTGACAQIEPAGQATYGLTVTVDPERLNDAFNTYTRLTGNDIKPFLPQPMLDFAAQRILN